MKSKVVFRDTYEILCKQKIKSKDHQLYTAYLIRIRQLISLHKRWNIRRNNRHSKEFHQRRLLYVTQQQIDEKSLFKLVVADADGENEQVLSREAKNQSFPHRGHLIQDKLHTCHLRQVWQRYYIQNIATGERSVAIENSSVR
jgi:hypothetical protein